MSSTRYTQQTHRVPAFKIRLNHRATQSPKQQLEIVVKQYTPVRSFQPSENAITILAAHGSGLDKELYEPLWDDLLDNVQNEIRDIYIADVAGQGESGLLNRGKLGNDPHWLDHAFDLLQVINYLGLSQPLVGVGHSMGGNQIISLALLHPSLFAGIIPIEPQLAPIPNPTGLSMMIAYAPTFRQDSWPSLRAAEDYFRRHPSYKTWDPRVLDLHIRYGLIAAGDAIKLRTTKAQDVFSQVKRAFNPGQPLKANSEFKPDSLLHPEAKKGVTRGANSPFYRPEALVTWHKLPLLRSHCLFVDAEKGSFPAKVTVARDRTTGVGLGGNGGAVVGAVQSIRVPGTHFVPLENPLVIAKTIAKWLDERYLVWKPEWERQRRTWKATVKKDEIDAEWIYWMKELKRINTTGEKSVSLSTESPKVKSKL